MVVARRGRIEHSARRGQTYVVEAWAECVLLRFCGVPSDKVSQAR